MHHVEDWIIVWLVRPPNPSEFIRCVECCSSIKRLMSVTHLLFALVLHPRMDLGIDIMVQQRRWQDWVRRE
ncbi:hypothetical protein CRE_28847 [Caenorhabditis remanei]|uniref:Uncharacterized protein n=1 Tax=Caenorhabditis remanei TaxID=31234 RepID=E3MXE3_CAERE|nr:hypothetical protein CRE_28847 [Caenorhabditis remanei]